jgi:hypothetical protein
MKHALWGRAAEPVGTGPNLKGSIWARDLHGQSIG